MTELQDIVIAAHGDIDRWRSFDRLTADVTNGGILWGLKGQPDTLVSFEASIDLHRQRASHSPFAGEYRTHFSPDRVDYARSDGTVVEERTNPRESFAGHTLETPWDRLHLAYFTGYAMRHYLIEPFLFAEPGFEFEELEPRDEDGETWRRLRVTFPEDLATHNRVQTYYIDANGLIRRHDYQPEVLGPSDGPSAHYSWDHKEFDGFVFPTKRSVHLTDQDGHKVPEPVLVSIDVHDVKFS